MSEHEHDWDWFGKTPGICSCGAQAPREVIVSKVRQVHEEFKATVVADLKSWDEARQAIGRWPKSRTGREPLN